MNKWVKRISAAGLCVVLVAGSAGLTFAQTDTAPAEKETSADQEQVQGKQTEDTQEEKKDETVYVMAGADGSVQKIIVSDWIKNVLSADAVQDVSELSDIETVKGEESYTLNGERLKVWDAKGNDIYYQGDIEKELPVGISVTYELNGKAVSPEEIKGQSGKVKIHFSYENNQYEMVQIDGKEEKIYVPFVMLTGMILDSDMFRNVEVSNGKLLNDGDHTVIAGIAFPGLQENLAISQDEIELPDYVEITADVTDFEMAMTVTIASNEVFQELDSEEMDQVDEAVASVEQLSDAMEQLLDGSSALYDGLCTLLTKSDELVAGINALADGAKELTAGATALDAGAGRVKAGLGELSSGLQTLSDNSASLKSGAKQVFEMLLATATTQIREAGLTVSDLTIDTYAEELNTLIDALDETAVYNKALQQVTEAVEANRSVITEKVTEAVGAQVTEQVTVAVEAQVTETVTEQVKQQVRAQILSTLSMAPEEYEQAVQAGLISEEQQTEIAGKISEQMDSEAVKETIRGAVEEQMNAAAVQATIKEKTEESMASADIKAVIADNVQTQIQQAIAENMASDAVQAQLTAAAEGAKSMIAVKKSLDSYNAFYLGLCSYTDGVDTAMTATAALYDGASELKDGTAELKVGAATLYDGILQLQDGVPALTEGVTQLRDGSMQLSDGLKRLNEEGIEKLTTLVEKDLGNLSSRLQATIDVAKRYRNFSGISERMDGQVTFLYRTDEISAE